MIPCASRPVAHLPARLLGGLFLICAASLVGCAATAQRAGTASVLEAPVVTGDGNTTSSTTALDAYLEFMSETRTRVDTINGNMTVNNFETAKTATFWALAGRYGLKVVESSLLALWLRGKKPKTENGVIVGSPRKVPTRIEDE